MSYAVSLMGGHSLPSLGTLEASIQAYTSPAVSPSSNALTMLILIITYIVDRLTHIICSYLNPSQRHRLESLLPASSDIVILSSNWLYSCVDQRTKLDIRNPDMWNSLLFRPSLRLVVVVVVVVIVMNDDE